MTVILILQLQKKNIGSQLQESFGNLTQCFSNRVSRHICVSPKISSVSPKNKVSLYYYHLVNCISLFPIKNDHNKQLPKQINLVGFFLCLLCYCAVLKICVCLEQKFKVKRCRSLKKVEKH
jgi:hypothetical protein